MWNLTCKLLTDCLMYARSCGGSSRRCEQLRPSLLLDGLNRPGRKPEESEVVRILGSVLVGQDSLPQNKASISSLHLCDVYEMCVCLYIDAMYIYVHIWMCKYACVICVRERESVCVYQCVQVDLNMCMWACLWGSEVDLDIFPQVLSTLFYR